MNDEPNNTISFAEFTLDTAHRRLLREGKVVALHAKAFDVLTFLLQNSGRVVSKDEILDGVWDGQFVEESNLVVQISNLRKALKEDKDSPRFLVTVPGKGYKFAADNSANSIRIETHSFSELTIEQEEDLGPQKLSLAEKQTLNWRDGRLRTIAVLAILIVGGIVWWRYSADQPAPSPASAQQVKAIAVLPFTNIESNQDDQLLGIGMADAIITKLSHVKNIVVRQTNSVMRYADTTPDATKVGREINVDAVLEGNIQKADGRIRVSVRLFRVGDGALLWAENFDERDTDIFALQDSISEKVANSLSLQVNADERDKFNRRYTENIEAYNLYQKGRFFWNNRNQNDLRKSIELFEQALRLDENYALAYSGVADSYVVLQFFSHTQRNDFFQKAKAAAEKALSLDKDLAEPHAALAMYEQLYEWDWEGAESDFKKAIAANPNYATAHQWYGEFLSSMGRFDESIAELEKAVELDPLSVSANTALAAPYLASRRYAEAIEKLKPALELDENFSLALLYMGRAYDGLGNHKEAIVQYQKNMKKPGGGGPYFTTALINSYARDGQKKEAQGKLNGLIRLAEEMPVSNYVLARGFAPLGYKEEALEKLEKAVEERDGLLIILRTDRNFDELREEPRFQKILTDMKLNN